MDNNIFRKFDTCYVCGETNSTGWHFGTITCEACKKFYLRNVDGEYKQYTCIRANQNCVITKSTRTSCPSCRFKKCIQVGMKLTEKNTPNPAISFKNISCTICGDSSSGLHFGAITCEGCKGFFRRSADEGSSFLCSNGGNCEININTRNLCRACRFKRCISVGMSLKNSKIGRQSNLFKQKLISTMDSSNMTKIKNEAICKPEENIDSNLSFASNDEASCSNTEIDSNLILDPKVKTVYEFYKIAFENYPVLNFDTENIPLGNFFPNYVEYNQVFLFLNDHINKCFHFLLEGTEILLQESFRKFNPEDQMKIVANSIHSIRLLQIACNSNNNSNYFGCDTKTFEQITQVFPVFLEIMPYLNSLAELIKSFKLDMKEFALYAALLAYSSAGRGPTVVKNCFGLNLETCKTLLEYMKLRRNESESCEMLIHYGFRFEKLNIRLQTGVFERFKQLEFYGIKPHSFCHKIIYSTAV